MLATRMQDKYRVITSDFGEFVLIRRADGSINTTWLEDGVWPMETEEPTLDRALLPDLVDRLRRYFRGEEVDFSDVATPHGSGFNSRCWEACRKIPRGATISYAMLARRAGSPSAFRAAGQAMRSNLLPVIVPCHRVIGASGKLHGFAGSADAGGGELALKGRLLQLEGWRG